MNDLGSDAEEPKTTIDLKRDAADLSRLIAETLEDVNSYVPGEKYAPRRAFDRERLMALLNAISNDCTSRLKSSLALYDDIADSIVVLPDGDTPISDTLEDNEHRAHLKELKDVVIQAHSGLSIALQLLESKFHKILTMSRQNDVYEENDALIMLQLACVLLDARNREFFECVKIALEYLDSDPEQI